MAWMFGITLFVSALPFFLVQPVIAKMLLPLLGGVPAIWNTCMVFFQGTLLAGYAYAHWTTARLSQGRQLLLHLTLLLLAGLGLPFRVVEPPLGPLSAGTDPSFWVLQCLTISVGLPFFVVATTSPLLQRWFSQSRHRSADDPYFLYVASNFGSLLALFAYPAVLEPHLRLKDQSRLWAISYLTLAVLIIVCGALVWRRQSAITE